MAEEIKRILNLTQIEQNTLEWYQVRVNKQTASDFGAVVPRTSMYIQHIVDRWDSADLSRRSKLGTCFTYGPSDYYLRKVQISPCAHVENDTRAYQSRGGGACAMGHQFEPVIRTLTSQHLRLSIVELGWVEGQHTPHAGVSPDGLVLDDTVATVDNHDQPHFYAFEHGHVVAHPQSHAGFRYRGPKNFEAKTLVSRSCTYQVPLKYHIQVERTAYELGVPSSIYAEARFTFLHEETWHNNNNNNGNGCQPQHLEYGLMLLVRRSSADEYVYPPVEAVQKEQFIAWRDHFLATTELDKSTILPIYYRLEHFWCVEIPLWDRYDEVYGPLIVAEADKLHWMATTSEGHRAYDELALAKRKEQEMRASRKRNDSSKKNDATISDNEKERKEKQDNLIAELLQTLALRE